MNILAGGFFFLAAYVQQNDPDAEFWIPLYAAPGLLSLVVSIYPAMLKHKRISNISSLITVIASVVSARTIHEHYDTDTDTHFMRWVMHDETGREFGGLFIVIMWLNFMHNPSCLELKLIFACLLIFVPIGLWIYVYFHEEFRKLWPEHCQSALYPDKMK